MERWMKDQVGPRALLARMRKALPLVAEELPELPLRLLKVVAQLERQGTHGDWRGEEMRRLRRELARQHAREVNATVGGVLILSGTLLLLFGPGAVVSGGVALSIATLCLVSGGVLLVRVGPWFD
jgi:ubiquinone biosynthesis protein